LWASAQLRVSTHLTYPEARAALAAAERGKRIDSRSLRQAVRDLETATQAMSLIGVDGPLAAEAGRLAQDHALRGFDAVHLATALSTGDHDLVLVTWDQDLAAAALRCGRPVAPALKAA
jgi:uncharacterized protein